MPVSADYLTYVLDQLAPLARVRARRMFGGIGLYADDLFFGIVDDDCLYFKVDDSNRNDYLTRGCTAFRPFADDPTKSMSYFNVPEDVIEDSDELTRWARKALSVALAAAARRPRKQVNKQNKLPTPARAKPRSKIKRSSRSTSAAGRKLPGRRLK